MTREEKMAALEAYAQPIIADRKALRDTAFSNYQLRESNYQDILILYENKKAEINAYYDLVEKLVTLTEPAIG